MTICIKTVVKWSVSAIDFVVEPVSEEELPEMAVSWSFALLLVLTLVALITFSQPLFQSTPAAEVRHTREDMELAPQLKHPTFKARESMVGSQRQHRTRKGMNERGESEQRQGSTSCCRGKRKSNTILQRKTITFSRSTTITTSDSRHPKPAAATARTGTSNNYHSNYAKIPRRSVSAHFESDRMVPTGPNPLHNNNRSQVIFP